jgi:hypothetical protein
LRLIALPCAILAIPFTLLMWQLDGFFGHAGLVIGEPVVVTWHLPAGALSAAALRAPEWIAVETPPVRSGDGQVSWRIRPLAGGSGTMEATGGGRVVTARVMAGNGPGGSIASGALAIPYPAARIAGMNWVIWFLLASAAGALARIP